MIDYAAEVKSPAFVCSTEDEAGVVAEVVATMTEEEVQGEL